MNIDYCKGCEITGDKVFIPCGCRKNSHKVLFNSDALIHYAGEHWVRECLIIHLMNLNKVNEKTIKTLFATNKNLKHIIHHMPCSICGKGQKIKRIVGDAVFCNDCSYDMGGG